MATQGAGSAANFVPKEEFLTVLQSLGITKNAATKALYYTGNANADLAAAWVFDNQDRADIDDPLSSDALDVEEEYDDSDLSAEFIDPDAFHKMVFVVNASLNMGVGKIAAQVGHASIGVYRELCEHDRFSNALANWEQFGETKIVLKGQTASQLQDLQAKAGAIGLATYLVQDAGHTQVDAGSMTVLGIMGKNDIVDQVTGQLSLL